MTPQALIARDILASWFVRQLHADITTEAAKRDWLSASAHIEAAFRAAALREGGEQQQDEQ